MKTKKEEAKLAFELWSTLTRLESILWQNYEKDFLNMVDLEITCYHRDKMNPFDRFGWTHLEVAVFLFEDEDYTDLGTL